MEPIIPVAELPKVFDLYFAKCYDDFPNSKRETFESYIAFTNIVIKENIGKPKLNDYFRLLETEYEKFINSIKENNKDFIPLENVKKNLNDIELESKNGDIVRLEIYDYYYIFTDTMKEKRIVKMNINRSSNNLILPEEALTMIKERKIHSYKDYSKFYAWRRLYIYIFNIDIPSKYYPDQLLDILSEPCSPFYFTNSSRSGVRYDGYLEAPRIPLDIGDGYILYVAPLAEYNKYFFRKAEIKI